MQFIGFRRRFVAKILDSLILIPIIILIFNFSTKSFFLYTLISLLGLISGLFIDVFCLYFFEASPGKIILKIKVVKANGKKIDFKSALFRISIQYLISIMINIYLFSFLSSSNIDWGNISYYDFTKIISNNKTYSILNYIFYSWFVIDFVIFLTNKQKRAFHDYIANTIVVSNLKPSNFSNSNIDS